MADFLTSFNLTFKEEGGYSTDVNDKGNYLTQSDYDARKNFIGTMYGISAPVLADYLGRTITAQDMKNLKYETARGIYRRDYFDKIRGSEIINQSVANLVFDYAVNHGIYGAARDLNAIFGTSSSVPINDALLAKLNSKDSEAVFKKIQQKRIQMHTSKTVKDRTMRFIYQATAAGLKQVPGFIIPSILAASGVVIIVLSIVFKDKINQFKIVKR